MGPGFMRAWRVPPLTGECRMSTLKLRLTIGLGEINHEADKSGITNDFPICSSDSGKCTVTVWRNAKYADWRWRRRTRFYARRSERAQNYSVRRASHRSGRFSFLPWLLVTLLCSAVSRVQVLAQEG